MKCRKMKCRKHSPAARAFYSSLVFSNACRVLSQCKTRLRLHYLLNKRTTTEKSHVESTRAMTRERGLRAEAKNCEILLFPTADRRFDRKVKCPTGRASFWVKFPTVRSLRSQIPGDCPGGMGGFGIDCYIID